MAANVIRILIVDDEMPARQRLKDLIDDCPGSMGLTLAGEAGSGQQALTWLNENDADIALLDIKMPGMSGIELAQHMAKLSKPPGIIFTTAYDQFALQAFEVNAIDYLLKPIRLERLQAALEKAHKFNAPPPAVKNLDQKSRQFLSVSERGKVVLVPIKEVLYLKAELKYVTVRTTTREYLLEESLTHLEQEFPEAFVRIHRNCLVARAYIAGFERATTQEGEGHWVAVLNGVPERLPISRRQQAIVREYRHL
ncbi:LytTR family DNA-binding domain-containing protein [Chitinivorax sp. B]|uniref:LytR/AlgR family response regulator transcription factor n=1 Tax=Chitinivorax sp. B TaxID=2502235 RepID=UPI0010F518D3|nr:LytTR family DNA-binding domain-containing protein [Chitinivorax sp. B]